MSAGKDVTTMVSFKHLERLVAAVCAVPGGSAAPVIATMGAGVRELLEGALAGALPEEALPGVLRRSGSKAAEETRPLISNIAPLSFNICTVLEFAHDLKNGGPLHHPGFATMS